MRITSIPGADRGIGSVDRRYPDRHRRAALHCTTGDRRVELRTYGPRIAAETTVAADEDRARNIGFRRLANYIFGGNHRDEQISMTAPVAQQSDRRGDEIAMTALSPVAGSDDGWTIRFFMPSKWTMDTLPTPGRREVALVTVPGETVAVLRFSGDRGPAAVAAGKPRLVEAPAAHGIEPVGDPSRGSTIRRGPCRSGGATKLPCRSTADDRSRGLEAGLRDPGEPCERRLGKAALQKWVSTVAVSPVGTASSDLGTHRRDEDVGIADRDPPDARPCDPTA